MKKAIFFINFLNILGDAVSHTNLRDLRGKRKKRPQGALKGTVSPKFLTAVGESFPYR